MKKSIVFSFFILVFIISGAQERNLDYYLNYALQNSPSLKDYQNQIQLNHIDSMQLHASLGPQINAISNNMYAPVINGWGYDEAITNGTTITALLAISKELTGKRNRDNLYSSVSLENQSLEISSKISEQNLKKDITEQYILTYGLWQQYNYNHDLLVLLEQEKKLIIKLTEQGIYRQTDYLSFIVNLKQQELGIAQLKIQYQGNLAHLNTLCGINDTSLVVLTDPSLFLTIPPDVQNSLMFQQFVTDSLKLFALDKQIDYMYRPKVNLYADAGFTSSLNTDPWKNFGPSIGVSIKFPFYDGHQRQMQHDKITISEQTRKNYQNFYLNNYTLQVISLTQQLKSTIQLEDQINEQVKFAQALIDVNRKLFETGDTQMTDYIISLINYRLAKNMVTQNTIAKYLLINQLNYLNLSK